MVEDARGGAAGGSGFFFTVTFSVTPEPFRFGGGGWAGAEGPAVGGVAFFFSGAAAANMSSSPEEAVSKPFFRFPLLATLFPFVLAITGFVSSSDSTSMGRGDCTGEAGGGIDGFDFLTLTLGSAGPGDPLVAGS